MESAVPGEVIDSCGCFEENNRCASRLRLLASHLARHRCDLEIVESADKSAFDALGEEIFHHNHMSLRAVLRSNLQFNKWTPSKNFHRSIGDCFVATNAPRNDITTLPIVIFFIIQSYQQIPRYILEQFPMFLCEMLFPTACLPRAEGVTLLWLDRIH